MKQLKLKGLKLAKFGKESYHMIVSKAFVDDAELLETNKEYDVIFSEVDENPTEKENKEMHLYRSLKHNDDNIGRFTRNFEKYATICE
jgi:hypothetical protein